MRWQTVCLLMVGGVVGCHAPPARVAGCDGAPAGPCRVVVLSRQVAADSAVTVAEHPVRTARVALTESADRLAAAGRGLLGKRLLMHLFCRPGPLDPGRPVTDGAALEACLADETAGPLQPAAVQLQTTGPEALAALLKTIDEAHCRLDVIMFMWDQTPLGQTIAQHLAARAGPDVPVRILVDGGGNVIFGEPDKAPLQAVNQTLCWLARQPYVQVVRIRNPCTRFDHRKLLIADGQVAWTGGRNFTEEGFFKRHDISVTVEGPLVAKMEERFEDFWREQGGAPASPLPASPDISGNAAARVVYTEPGAHVLERTLYTALDHACHHVYVENPYLTDGGLVYKLARARQRGADVRVMFSITTDTPAINHANRVTANRLLHAGVRVYLYPGLLHTKAAAVDDCWAYLGTGNFDPRSLRMNHEIGLSISGGPLLDEIGQRVFQVDFRPEWELKAPLHITPADYYYELLSALFL